MLNDLPNLQPGTKIIVRHRANGDTEYICRPDNSGSDPFSDILPDGFGRVFWIVIFLLGILWFLRTDSPRRRAADGHLAPDNTEIAIDQ